MSSRWRRLQPHSRSADTGIMHIGVSAIACFLGLGAFVGFLLYGRVVSHLRDRHEATWSELGAPQRSPGSMLSDRAALQRFLWAREFDAIADPELARRCQALRWFLVIWIFSAPVVLLVASSWRVG